MSNSPPFMQHGCNPRVFHIPAYFTGAAARRPGTQSRFLHLSPRALARDLQSVHGPRRRTARRPSSHGRIMRLYEACTRHIVRAGPAALSAWSVYMLTSMQTSFVSHASLQRSVALPASVSSNWPRPMRRNGAPQTLPMLTLSV